MNRPEQKAASSKGVRLALAASMALLILGALAFYFASRQALSDRGNEDAVVVHVLPDRCEPDTLSVPAGRSTFRIVNDSSRAVEWEILDGVMVVEERENILPGFQQTLSVNLQPGRYDMTCGLLSNPRGTLNVTATEASEAARKARPRLVEFIGALAEYRVYLLGHADALLRETQAMQELVAAGDMALARQAYRKAYVEYALIEPAAGTYADLATRMDGRATYFERREADPAFSGFRRLNAPMLQDRPDADLGRLTEALIDDARNLRERLAAATFPPDRMASGAARTVAQLADGAPVSLDAETAQARSQAGVQGAYKVFQLLKPFIDKRDPEQSRATELAFERVFDAPQIASQRALAGQLGRMGEALGYE